MKTIAIKAAVAASLSVLAIAPAAAQEVTATVQYGDIDTASADGVQELTQRLETGVNTVCDRPDMRNLKAMSDWQACKSSALSSAVEQLNRNGVTVLAN